MTELIAGLFVVYILLRLWSKIWELQEEIGELESEIKKLGG